MIPVWANKFFRLPLIVAKGNLVVNTGRNSVYSVQFHSHKLLQSWTLKQPHSFSCPVVYDHHKNELLCVIDKNVVIVWNHEADSLKGAKEVKFQDTIFAIIPVENQHLVVFHSGSCLLLEAALSKSEFIMQPYLKNEENLLWADASAHESKLHIFLLTLNKDEHKLHSLLLNMHDGQTEKISEQVISRDSSSLQSWCKKLDDAQISFITLWSDGQVHGYNKYGKPSIHLWTIPGVQDKELLAVEAVDPYHIVFVRYHPSCGCSYEVWDTKYATRKTHKSIDLVVPENLQVRVLEDTLFIPSSQGIVAEPLEVTFPTLAAVIGKSSNTDEVHDVVYSWTPDGLLVRKDVEESRSDISNCKFSTITRNEVFQEFLSRLDGQNAEKISSCLREVEFISESKLVKLLQYLLREKCLSDERPASKSSKKEIAKIFLELFLIPFNDVDLQQHLRKLTLPETVATLKIVTKLLGKNIFGSTLQNGCWSAYMQLVKWESLLLLSHFMEFVLSTDKEMSVVENLQTVVNNKIAKCREVSLQPFWRKELKFERSTSSLYCIEVLYL